MSLNDAIPASLAPFLRNPAETEFQTPLPPTPTAPQQVPASRPTFFPEEPKSLGDAKLKREEVEALAMKFLFNAGSTTGRRIADQLKLPFGIVHEVLQSLKTQLLLTLKSSAPMNDYEYQLTEKGLQHARRHNQRCTYFGAAPVHWGDYVRALKQQSNRYARPGLADLRGAFSDLILPNELISQVGQAVHAGKGLFLYGPPGNGKTSIAERVMLAVNQDMWIPRALTVTGEIIRLFDPGNHEEIPLAQEEHSQGRRVDRRWIRIRRPTVVVGGEFTMDHLEFTFNSASGIVESPLQLKSSCGAMVVDDLGRQSISMVELLNRWIIPLQKGHYFLTLPSGRQLQAPFDQLLIFATNFDPKELVDEAFLRRIPYKIEVGDPDEETFRELFRRASVKMSFDYRDDAVTHLLESYYWPTNRPLRYCHAGDILEQVRVYCELHNRPMELTRACVDIAGKNYFAGL